MSYFGMAEIVPAIPATIIFALSFFLTLFKAHGILFGYREYDGTGGKAYFAQTKGYLPEAYELKDVK